MMESSIIGDKIAKARKKANLSQAQLGEQLFISPQAVGKWERGESVPDIVTINKLANILKVDLNYFSGSSVGAEDHVPQQPGIQNAEEDLVVDQGRQLLTDFSGSALQGTDFAGVRAHRRKFNGSALRGADFSKADLTSSSFKGSDLKDAKFDRTNLTDCSLHAVDLSNASFIKTILVRTQFSASELNGARFAFVNMSSVKLTAMDLRRTVFETCSFSGVDFKASDLSGLNLEGQIFKHVSFNDTILKNTSFRGATLHNVSFSPAFALTNKYYRAIRTISFEGASMDKLTHATLKGMGAELADVKVQ